MRVQPTSARPTAPPWIVLPAILALAYALAVVGAAWRAPDKGFLAFTGHRVVHVDDGGPASRAGLAAGDVITHVDGAPIASTFDYADRVLTRRPGDTVAISVRRGGEREDLAIRFERAPPPWGAIAATVLATVLLVLGLIARIGRGADPAARLLYRTVVVYALVYVGALSWAHLVVHPLLAAVFAIGLFAAPPIALDLALSFAEPLDAGARRQRKAAYVSSVILSLGCLIALGVAIADYRAARVTDRALLWVVGFVTAQLVFVVAQAGVAVLAQVRALARATGPARAQLRWIVAGNIACGVPSLVAIPLAVADLDHFLLVGYRPIVVTIAVLWFLAYGLAVLRVRLADVDAVLRTSLGYAVTTGAAAAVYLAVVLAIGVAAERAGGAGWWPHLAAGLAAAALFGPIRARVGAWIDRRFFRDRAHYVEALRQVSESIAVLREPEELAREVAERVVAAVRAESGSLRLRDDRELAAGRDGASPVTPPIAERGIVVTVGDPAAPLGWLVLGPRLSGDLYSTEDRDLLAALAGQLAVALANARAYGTIAAMSRSLEAQNVEIQGLRDRLEDENRYLRARVDAATEGAALVGESKAVRELVKTIERVAQSDASVLVLGESGTGKGLVARTLHALSPRAAGPFIHVDCGALAAGVFESELFGHERGAFTGAARLRHGHVELADGGTLFLDEIGELPLELQPKLLRVLETRSVVRVGGSAPVAVDVRFLAATHRRLTDMVAAGTFREDLFFRLHVVEVAVPPLRARRADLAALCDALIPRVARRCGRAPRPLSADALARLGAYGWPGNVRELENVLERALVLGDADTIAADELELPDRPAVPDDVDADAGHGEVMEEIEKKRLVAALRAAGGNQSSAARALGLPRTTFINKLRRYGLGG